jgi:hypothetical protein
MARATTVWAAKSSYPQSPSMRISTAEGSEGNALARPGTDPSAASALKAKLCRRKRRRVTVAESGAELRTGKLIVEL